MPEELARIDLVNRRVEMELRTRQVELGRISRDLSEFERGVKRSQQSYQRVLNRLRGKLKDAQDPKISIHTTRLILDSLRRESRDLKSQIGHHTVQKKVLDTKLQEIKKCNRQIDFLQERKSGALTRKKAAADEIELEGLIESTTARLRRSRIVADSESLGGHFTEREGEVDGSETGIKQPLSLDFGTRSKCNEVTDIAFTSQSVPTPHISPNLEASTDKAPPCDEQAHSEHGENREVLDNESMGDSFIKKLSVWETTTSQGIALTYYSSGHAYEIEVMRAGDRALAVHILPEQRKDRIKLGTVKEEILSVLTKRGYKVRRFIVGGKTNE